LGLTPEQMQCLELININVDELHIIVNNLFDIVYAESGELQLTTGPVPLENLIRTMSNELGPRVLEKSQELELVIQSNLSPILCDPTRVTQVLKSLVVNACNFSPSGSVITLAVSTTDEAGYIKVSVKDQGINIPDDERESVFEQFYRSNYGEQARSRNAGLGLHIAQILIELHGGEIWCNSNEDGPGSTFHFTLPTVAHSSNNQWASNFEQNPLLYNSVRLNNNV